MRESYHASFERRSFHTGSLHYAHMRRLIPKSIGAYAPLHEIGYQEAQITLIAQEGLAFATEVLRGTSCRKMYDAPGILILRLKNYTIDCA